MKKITLVLALLVLVIGCAEQAEEKQELANPASVHCEEQGGISRMEKNEAGQYGVCALPDGTECEELMSVKKDNNYDEFLSNIQKAKMKELGDNKKDDFWENA